MARLPQGCISSEGTAQGHERVADVWEEWGSLLGLGGGSGLSPITLVGLQRVRESNTRKNAHHVCRLQNHPGKCLSSIRPSVHPPIVPLPPRGATRSWPRAWDRARGSKTPLGSLRPRMVREPSNHGPPGPFHPACSSCQLRPRPLKLTWTAGFRMTRTDQHPALRKWHCWAEGSAHSKVQKMLCNRSPKGQHQFAL